MLGAYGIIKKIWEKGKGPSRLRRANTPSGAPDDPLPVGARVLKAQKPSGHPCKRPYGVRSAAADLRQERGARLRCVNVLLVYR
jgi:hypothetical protein